MRVSIKDRHIRPTIRLNNLALNIIQRLTPHYDQDKGEEDSQQASSLLYKFYPKIDHRNQAIRTSPISNRLHTSSHTRALSHSSQGLEALLPSRLGPTLLSPDLLTQCRRPSISTIVREATSQMARTSQMRITPQFAQLAIFKCNKRSHSGNKP